MFTRETRLLLVTMALSAVVVLTLSTLRFPQAQPAPEAPPAPLERLAATVAYEQLARSVERVSRLITSTLLPLRVEDDSRNAPRSLAQLFGSPASPGVTRYCPALRVGEERAVVVGAAVAGPGVTFVDRQGRRLAVVAIDPLRQLTVVSVPAERTARVSSVSASDLQPPTYVVVAEGTAAGVTFRPVFVGSADRFSDSRWTRPLLAVSGSPLTNPGALLFSLDGQFIGPAVVGADGALAIAAAAEVIAAVTEAGAGGAIGTRDFGLHLQSLTPALGRLLGATHGAVVASVNRDSPAAGLVEPTDVIASIDGVAIVSPDHALVQLARTRPGAAVQVGLVRGGQPRTVSVAAVPPSEGAAAATLPAVDGVVGAGARLSRVLPGTALAAAGLRDGDVVVRVGSDETPTPQEVTSALRAGVDGTGVVLVVRRNDGDRVIGVPPATGRR